MSETVEIGAGPCCFCGELIAESRLDPCRVTVETHEGPWQVWFAHSVCFKDRIIKSPEIDLSSAHF